MDTSHSNIGELLRQARAERGLTGREVGRLIDRSEAQISKWETGTVNPGADVLGLYAKAGLLRIDTGGEAA